MFYVDETGTSQPTAILRDGLGPVAEVKLSTTTFTKGGPELGQIKITRPPNDILVILLHPEKDVTAGPFAWAMLQPPDQIFADGKD